jgi:photosystem II stability/assembly factor-like uncharacterized protein
LLKNSAEVGMDKQSATGVFMKYIPAVIFATCLVLGLTPASLKAETSAADKPTSAAESSSVVMNASLFGLSFSGQNNGWLVGKGGTIVRTMDAGKTWSLQKSGEKLHLYDVSFCDDSNGWAVGESGLILHTTNGGTTWSQQQSGITGNLRAIQCLDAGTAWVAGFEGALLKTADGGKTWVLQAKVQDMLKQLNRKFLPSLFGVRFSDARNGYAVGHPGIILRTTDGGETWQQQQSGTEAILYSVSVQGAMDAWISGGSGVICHTSDGGATWVQQKSGVSFMLNSIAFADKNKGFAIGHKCILYTDNGGESWSKYDLDLSRWLYGIRFTDSENGWVIGDSGTVYTTQDGGRNWDLHNIQVKIE